MDSEWFAEATKNSVMGTAARELPWDQTPLGRPTFWPPTLRSAVRLCFSTRFPVMIAWGPELTMIYNDGYRDMLGTDKRLNAMGRPASEVWAEVWDEIGPIFSEVMSTGLPSWTEDAPLRMNRSGFDEETSFTFSYSPLRDADGTVCGVLDISTETTDQVVDRRRLTTIDALHVAMQDHRGDAASRAALVVEILRDSPDVGRAALHLATGVDLALAATTHPDEDEAVPDDVVEKVFATRQPVSATPRLVVPLARPHDPTVTGVITLEGNPYRPFDAAQRSYLMVVASAVGAAFSADMAQQREVDLVSAHAELAAREAERVRESSVALQHSLLTPPPEPDHLHVVVRYQPATRELEIGGDWYDAFLTQDGATTLVIGDVTGHDHHAAAAMGQIRGLIRAIAYDCGETPARVLERTDRAIRGLGLGPAATATVVLARVEEVPDDPTTRILRWSNAGHPAPVVVRADGHVELLRRTNDLILGLSPDRERTDYTIALSDDDTILFYTDGLVERRGQSMAETTGLLLDALVGAQDEDLDSLCDRLLTTLAPGDVDDDVAVVALRPYPQDAPRPVEAGPEVVPAEGEGPFAPIG